jgi:hypothetical protein
MAEEHVPEGGPRAMAFSLSECQAHKVPHRPFQFFDIRTAGDDMIVQPLIIYVMMEKKMEKKYQIVAWTRNTKDGEVEVRMIPEMHHQAQEHLFDGIAECNRKGDSAQERRILLLEQSGDFNLMTGHYGEGLRFLRAAALACFHSQIRWEFLRIYEKFHERVKKYCRPDILMEKESRLLEDLYERQASVGKDM